LLLIFFFSSCRRLWAHCPQPMAMPVEATKVVAAYIRARRSPHATSLAVRVIASRCVMRSAGKLAVFWRGNSQVYCPLHLRWPSHSKAGAAARAFSSHPLWFFSFEFLTRFKKTILARPSRNSHKRKMIFGFFKKTWEIFFYFF
jgi:hypothetical protein